MGSSRRRHSTGRKAGPFPASKRAPAPTPPKPGQRSRPDLDAILGRLSDSLAIIATAGNALARAQGHAGTVAAQDVSEEIATLEHGVRALRKVYNEIDVALLGWP